MAHVIVKDGKYDEKFIGKNVQFKIVENGTPKNVGWDGYKKFLEQFTPEMASRVSGVYPPTRSSRRRASSPSARR